MVVRSKKIRIYPKQTEQMCKWFGLSRYWFNKSVDYLKKPETKASLGEVRKAIQVQSDHPAWAFDCPQRIRDHAMADAVKAVKNAKIKCRSGNGFQDVGFRSRKDPKQVFGFDAQSLHEQFVFSQKGFRSIYHAAEPIEADMEGTRIVRENGRYFVVVPREVPVKVPENQRLSQVAIDPGVRTFITFFSPELNGEIGNGDFNKVMRLCFGLDKLMSKIAKATCKAKRNMKKAAQKARWKIKDLISDLHHKAARFLVNTFDTIYIPSFETSQMVTKLTSKTARMMQTFSHYSFRQFLIAKAEEYSAKVVICNEAYTSKTCSYCGKIHKIGSKKVMKCECGVKVSRDYNGARGILLRALAVTPPLETVGNC